MNSQKYRDDILQNVVLPFLQGNAGLNLIYQDDNATPHRTRIVTTYKQQNNIPCIEWPANFPDGSPIENARDELERRVKDLDPPAQTMQELQQALVG